MLRRMPGASHAEVPLEQEEDAALEALDDSRERARLAG
jgi:hypothetical protein